MRIKYFVAAMLAALGLAAAVPASAQTNLTTSDFEVPSYDVVTISNLVIGSENVLMGAGQFTFVGPTGPVPNPVTVWCIDPNTVIQTGGNTYHYVTESLADFLPTYSVFQLNNLAGLIKWGATHPLDNALQGGIWEKQGTDVFSGNATVQANVDAWGASPLSANWRGVTVLKSTDDPMHQGFGFWSGTPEPATWAMLIMGFGLSGAMLRRTRQLKLQTA